MGLVVVTTVWIGGCMFARIFVKYRLLFFIFAQNLPNDFLKGDLALTVLRTLDFYS